MTKDPRWVQRALISSISSKTKSMIHLDARTFLSVKVEEQKSHTQRDETICDIEEGEAMTPEAKVEKVNHKSIKEKIEDITQSTCYDQEEGQQMVRILTVAH